MKAIVFNEELLKRLTGSDEVKVLTEKRHNELLEKIDNLKKKLDITTKALNNVYHDMKCWTFISKRDRRVLSVICKALKEMEGVK